MRARAGQRTGRGNAGPFETAARSYAGQASEAERAEREEGNDDVVG